MPDWADLALLVFALGLRHGLDADHLATDNGFARDHARARPALARSSGLLFSLRPGSAVIAIATFAALNGSQFRLPAWLATSGGLVLIAFLLRLGTASLRTALRPEAGPALAARGLKARLLPLVPRTACGVAGAGLLFAFSLDTMGLALFFPVAGSGVRWAAPALVLLFMLASYGLAGYSARQATPRETTHA